MGADLCGFILIGPSKLSETDIGNARGVLADIETQIEEYRTLHRGQDDDELGDDSLLLKAAAETAGSDVQSFVDDYGDAVEDKLLDTFLGLWHGEDSLRDMMARPLPEELTEGKDPHQVFVAGERSWGDGPEPWSAWWICQVVDALGLLTILGIG